MATGSHLETAPGHVEAVRTLVFDRLSAAQIRQLAKLCDAMLDTPDDPGDSISADSRRRS